MGLQATVYRPWDYRLQSKDYRLKSMVTELDMTERLMHTLLHIYIYIYICIYELCMLSCFSGVQLFETPWTVTHHSPLSMELSRQEYWSGLLILPPEDLPNPGSEPGSPALAGGFLTVRATKEAYI